LLPFVEELPISGASITVFDSKGRQTTICASDETAAQIDELQFDLGEGPRFEALHSGLSVLGAAPDRWPIFAAALDRLGVGTVFAFPMFLGAVTVGVVDLYSRGGAELGSHDVKTAARLTRQATRGAVQEALHSAVDDTPDAPATPAMRREVHQATGIVLVQLDTTATEAFLRLRAHAFATGRAVQAVARDVVSGTLDFSDLPD
jgi:hypothetical protein